MTVFSRAMGYGDRGLPSPSLPSKNEFIVSSWNNDLQQQLLEAQVHKNKTNKQTNKQSNSSKYDLFY